MGVKGNQTFFYSEGQTMNPQPPSSPPPERSYVIHRETFNLTIQTTIKDFQKTFPFVNLLPHLMISQNLI